MLTVTILGSNSAIPANNRNPSSQFVQSENAAYLVDCGEGTQLQLNKYKLKWSRISHIFISHLHGDHYFGLIGLITTMSLLGRKKVLHIYGPEKLKSIIDLQLSVAGSVLPFELFFHPLGENGEIANDEQVSISSFRVDHRIDCWGFIFRERKFPRKIIPQMVAAYEVPYSFYKNLQLGENYINAKGTIVSNADLTEAAPAPRSYAYCADTIFSDKFLDDIKGVNLLYHESTYLKSDVAKAIARFHCTSEQAATTAKKANVEKLIIGHFSSRYDNLESFAEEARAVFPNTELAIEGKTFEV